MCTCAAGHPIDCDQYECGHCGLKQIGEYQCTRTGDGVCQNNNKICKECFTPRVCVYVGDVADGLPQIHTLRGIDADIFNENLNREPTEEENNRVREWVGVDGPD